MKHNEVITTSEGKHYRLDLESKIKAGDLACSPLGNIVKLEKTDDLRYLKYFNDNYAKVKEIKSKKSIKVAKLVTFETTVRVVVERFTGMSELDVEDLAIEKALSKAVEALRSDGLENVSAVVDDKECPAGTFDEDTK